MFLHKSIAETKWSPPLVFLLRATDRVLQAGQSRCIRYSLPFMFDKSLHHGPVTAHLVEQVIEQRGFPDCACKQFLCRSRFSPYLPQNGFNGEREFTFGAKLGTFLCLRVYRVNKDYWIASTISFAIAFAPSSFGISPKATTKATLSLIFTHN
jgi:hypothetical protein